MTRIRCNDAQGAPFRSLSDALNNPYYESSADTRMKIAVIRSLRPRAPNIPMAAVTTFLTSTPKGPQKFVAILSARGQALTGDGLVMNGAPCYGENLRFEPLLFECINI